MHIKTNVSQSCIMQSCIVFMRDFAAHDCIFRFVKYRPAPFLFVQCDPVRAALSKRLEATVIYALIDFT